MATDVIPILKAIYLCDDVLEDSSTRKVHVLGLFNAIRPTGSPAYPHVQRQFCVFAQFVEGLGEVSAYVRIVNARRDELIFASPEHRLRFPGRQTLLSVSFRIEECVFAEPATYLVEVYCQNTFLDDRILHLLGEEEDQP